MLSKAVNIPSLTILFKRCLKQLKSARAVAVKASKKIKSEASSVLNTHPEIEDDKLSMADTRTWSWNESANESGSNTEEGEEDDENESDFEVEKARAVSRKAPKKEIKWNQEREDKLHGVHGIGSRLSLKRQRKPARELEEQASKTYDIRALW